MNDSIPVDINQLIEAYGLQPHPEGGYYRETYRSSASFLTAEGELRNASTAIYFLLTEGILTQWHKVRSDEMWHHYSGAPVVLEVIQPVPVPEFQTIVLGADWGEGEVPQYNIKAGFWQRAYSKGSYSLVGCTVTPGFDFEDFELKKAEELARDYHEFAKQIQRDPFSED